MTEVIRTVAVVGLGNMGTPMAARLVGAGLAVRVSDISADARARAAAAGATDAPDVATAVAGADAVILMLPDSTIVASVVRDPEFREALAPHAIVIDMSSSEPARTRELAAGLAERGIRMIDAPVSGGVKGAVAGTLMIMVGGTAEELELVRPVLEVFGRPVHAGPVGAGDAIKALNNLLSATHLWITSEAIAAGERFGLDPEVMLAVFNGSSGRSGSTENKWPNFVIPGGFDSGFGLALMLKDMRIAVQLSEQAGAPSALGAGAVELWARAAADLGPGADHTEVARWIRDHAGDTGGS
jgi:3-hydroxyisobutyrate dehydrogenase